MIKILLAIAALMIVMFFFGYAEIYEPLGTIVAVLIVATVSAKTGVASDTKYRELKDNTEKDKCKVHRNGVITVIDVDDVVVGDKVLLQSGDKSRRRCTDRRGTACGQLRTERRGRRM